MVASAIEIDKRWEQEGSPWFNFFEEVDIPAIDQDASGQDKMPRNG
jgi:hypothetical protein